MNWLRWYVGTCTDAKLHRTARLAGVRRSVVIAAWAALLEEARRNGDEGEVEDVDHTWLSQQIDESKAACRRVLDAFSGVGLLDQKIVKNFQKRQFPSDSSTKRVAAWRAKQLETHDTDPPGNVTVTADQNRLEQIRKKESPSLRSGTPDGVVDADLDTLFYRRGKALLGRNAGGQLTKLRGALGSVGAALQAIDDATHKESPAEYIAGLIRTRGMNGHGRPGRVCITTAALNVARRMEQADQARERAAKAENGDGYPRLISG